MVEEHRLLAKPLVTLGTLEPELVIHVLVLVLQPVGAEHLSAKSARKTLLIFRRVLVHEVLPQPVDPLERLALGGAVFAQAVEPSVLFSHGHVDLGYLHVSLVRFGVFKFLRNLVIGNLA